MLLWIIAEMRAGQPESVRGGIFVEGSGVELSPPNASPSTWAPTISITGSMVRLSVPHAKGVTFWDFPAQIGRRAFSIDGAIYSVLLLSYSQLGSTIDIEDLRSTLFDENVDVKE